MALPFGLMFELRDYQEGGVDFLIDHPEAGLFIDMGLGKTATVLHAILELPRPVLIVAPIRVIETVWMQEALRWMSTGKLTFQLLRGSPKERRAAAEVEADVYLVNPELLEDALRARKYAVLILDESTLFKNPSTSRFKMLRKHLHKFERRIILTGTPTPNSLLDLWSQIFILDMGARLGKAFGRFKQKYFYQTDYQGYKFAPHDWARDEILEKISDIIYRVSSKGALAPRTVIRNPVKITLPDAARKHYRELERVAFTRISEDKTLTAATAATVMMKLRQVASGFVYDDDGTSHMVHTEKIKAVQSILEETGSPVILVYQFQHELAALKKAFPSGKVFESADQAAWDAGELPLVFLHPQSGGHGLNMQYGGHTMIIFSGSFSNEQMSQIMGRIDRQGQEATVIFHFLISVETVDELIVQVLDEKQDNQNEVLRLIKEYADAKTKLHSR